MHVQPEQMNSSKIKPNTQNIQQPIDQLKLQHKLQSSAFPPQKTVGEPKSVFHQILNQCEKKTSNLRLRLTNKQSDIREIWNFQLQWFPLAYGQNFYNKILNGHYRCLVAQAQIQMQIYKLVNILTRRYKQDKQRVQQQQKAEKKPKYTNPVFLRPSSYFQQQGLSIFPLRQQEVVFAQQFTKLSLNDSKKQTKQQKNVNIHIIIGVTVFDIVNSDGYLKNNWLSQALFGTPNSIYINTIGVMQQFRKNGIAKKMLQWIIQKIAQQKIFKLVYLHVIQYNVPAIKLYRKIGFSQLAEIDNYYSIQGKEYKAKVLGLFLNGGVKRVGWGQWFKGFFN